MAELFTSVNVADVHLYGRNGNGTQGIMDSDAGVGVCACIEHNAITLETTFLNLVDESTLRVALKVVYLVLRVTGPEFFKVAAEGLSSIDARFPDAEQIEVRAVDDLDEHKFECLYGPIYNEVEEVLQCIMYLRIMELGKNLLCLVAQTVHLLSGIVNAPGVYGEIYKFLHLYS